MDTVPPPLYTKQNGATSGCNTLTPTGPTATEETEMMEEKLWVYLSLATIVKIKVTAQTKSNTKRQHHRRETNRGRRHSCRVWICGLLQIQGGVAEG